ncbi:MAG: CopG family transcriptional regulator [Sedimenticola sp.]|jgi:hypothetical protein|nr:MAG: CopG family transcriptional regulator [Sedimenticola sp.]
MTIKKTTKPRESSGFGKLTIWLLAGITLAAGSMLFSQQPARAADVVVYKSPTCGCCKGWVSHLQGNGFFVEVHDQRDMNPVKAELGVPRHLQSCHTAKVGDYVIEGHVPANDIKRLLEEKPAIAGLSAPGMPMGSPGMEGPRKDPYDVLTFQRGGKTTVYSRHNQ